MCKQWLCESHKPIIFFFSLERRKRKKKRRGKTKSNSTAISKTYNLLPNMF